MDDTKHPYVWYSDRFCKDLGLCRHVVGGWGTANSDAGKVEAIAKYYLEHPEYCRVGREMLVECLLASFEDRLFQEQPQLSVQDLVLRAINRAIDDPYDRDALRPYWETPSLPNDPNPLGDWLRGQFPGRTLPPSVWAK